MIAGSRPTDVVGLPYTIRNARGTRARETGVETSAVQIAPVAGATGRVRVPITGLR
jgi:hypothetical protein